MYIDIWRSFYRLCLLLRVRMWAFWDPIFFVFTLSYFFENEMSDLLLWNLGHCPFHHYIHYWCDFTPCLTWVDHHFSSYIHCFVIILVVACDSSYSLHPLFFSYTNPFQVLYFSCIILAYLITVWFSSLSHYWYYIHIGHPQVHGSQVFLYMLHFIHEGMSFLSLGIWAYFPFISITLSP